MDEFKLGKHTWPEISKVINDIAAVMVPVGSTEQHGPHLPFDTDTFVSVSLAERCAELCRSRGTRILITPPVSFGVSWYHKDFAGTLSLTTTVYISLIKDLLRCLIRDNFKNIILLNSHGGNTACLTVAINDIYEETRHRVYLVNWASLVSDQIQSLGIRSPLIHTEEVETSVAMALEQRVVSEKRQRDCFSRRKVYEEKGIPTSEHVAYDALDPGHGVVIPMDYVKDISKSGIVGDATLGTQEKGKEIVLMIVKRLADLISDLSTKNGSN